jgi:hypothetical protein
MVHLPSTSTQTCPGGGTANFTLTGGGGMTAKGAMGGGGIGGCASLVPQKEINREANKKLPKVNLIRFVFFIGPPLSSFMN